MSSLLTGSLLAIACSGGDNGDQTDPTPTPGGVPPTAEVSPVSTVTSPVVTTPGPIVVATPGPGVSRFNDPDRAHTVSGFVLDSVNGSPLRGVSVRETSSGTGGISDEFGFYRIDGLTTGLHTLEISGFSIEPLTAEFESETWTRLDLSVGVVGDPASRRVFDVIGSVTDRDSGKPIKGALVSAIGSDATIDATTDDSGHYVISAAPDGQYEISVTSVGYPVHTEELGVNDDIAWEVFLRAPPSSITGQVSGDAPGGVRFPEGSGVRVIDADSAGPTARTVATSEISSTGAYTIDGLPPGRYQVEAIASGYQPSQVVVELTGGGNKELDFALSLNGSSLYVTLASSTYGNIPVDGVEVRIQGIGGTGSEGVSLEAVTDPFGLASFINLPPGSYDIWTPDPSLKSGSNSADLYPLHQTVSMGPDETRALNADLPAINGDLHGFVRVGDKAGQTRIGTSLKSASTSSGDDIHEPFAYLPVQLPKATLTITSSRFGDRVFSPPTTSVISDNFGNYVLPLPPGTYAVTVTSDGLTTSTTTLTVTSTPTANDFRLKGATTAVVGRVDGTMIQDLTHLADADFAVSGARVLLTKDGRVWAAETDSRGVFSIEDLPLTVLNGAAVSTGFKLDITHPDYLPVAETLVLSRAEGATRIMRGMPTLAAGGFLDVAITVTDKNGGKTAAIGTLDSIQNLRTMDVFDARFLEDDDSVEIPHVISLRARPGQYRVRVCPDVIGIPGCYDHFWTSVGGDTDSVVMSFICGDSTRTVKCSFDGGIPASHIQATGFVFNASTGLPVQDAKVAISLPVNTQYCSEECTAFAREFSAIAPTGPDGRFQIEFSIPLSNGGADLVDWSWDGANRLFSISAPGYQTKVDTGPGGNVRLFDDRQDYYMAPSGQLNLLVVGAANETSPVSGTQFSLGQPVGGQQQARITLAPLGADLWTSTTGSVSFNIPTGSTDVIVDAPGHYPYTSSLLVPDATDDKSVVANFTLPLEQIPPPEIQAETFRLVQTADSQPIKGYVLHGVSSTETQATWSVRVDRDGVRTVRSNFEDPVESVNLVIHQLEACPGVAGTPASTRTVLLTGTLLSGGSNGVGTWGGQVDVAGLPCGSLGWRIEAETSHSLVTQGVDLPLWPSEPRYPLSLLSRLSEQETNSGVDSPKGQVGSDLVFSRAMESLSVTRDGEYFSYRIPGIGVETDIGPASSSSVLDNLSGDASRAISEHTINIDAELSGRTGVLDIRVSGSESGPYSLTATELFTMDSAVETSSGISDSWGESISFETILSRVDEIEIAQLPDPLRSTLAALAVSAVEGGINEVVSVDASWQLSGSPENGETAPLVGERRVVAGTDFEIVSVSEFEYAISVMSHLSVEGHLEVRSVSRFVEQDGSGNLREERTIASGQMATRSELWSMWESRQETMDFPFFNRVAGSDGVALSSVIEGSPAWIDQLNSALASSGSNEAEGLVATGGQSRPSIAATRDSNGKLFVASVSPKFDDGNPIATGISIIETDDGPGSWTSPSPLEFISEATVTDTALVVEPGGDLLLVWTRIAAPDGDPQSFILAATTADLMYSRRDAGDGTWSTPVAITSDNRPDFAPVIASDNEGRIVVAWARDMDGNVLTSDDVIIFSSDWISGNWTVPRPAMAASGAVSEISLSLDSGAAVIGVVTNTPRVGSAIHLSFNSLGRWSPANIIAVDRPGLTNVGVLMQSSGLALVAWNERTDGDRSRLHSVEATSAGVRGEMVAVDNVTGLVDLSLVEIDDTHHLIWTSDNGASLHGVQRTLTSWDSETITAIESGLSTRLIVIPGAGSNIVITFHEVVEETVPGILFLPISAR
ncbi:MAG: hypothetical protein HOC77_14125 [Chloroflexi bacterium]|nr:hypothetical protein [Chloroflexota bacterium]MBT4073998.1 hypothetical protein [Chloroflexota bacterium]MBT4516214.1 hypothetical protein [Chloroflexota bacterium]MBT6680656.1 hypothetical protein [Chloroflexota bacterium]